MIRALHRWPGLLALALVTILALSGAALSVFPAAERLAAPQAEAGLTVASLAARIQAAYPGVEQIRRAPSGRITAYWFDQGTPGAAVIDPATGEGVASADPSQVERWLTNLHRSLFLGDGGRIAMAAGAAAMLVLALSGAALVARRTGGWRHWFARLRGPLAGRLHVEIARIAVIGLVLSSTTALWMTASTFDLLPGGGAMPASPTIVSGETSFPLDRMPALRQTPVAELRDLSFPYPGDATDVFTLKTDRGTGYLDQGNGELLAWVDLTGWERVSATIVMLHTGRGAATLGLVLGFMALGVPAMGATGVLVWLAGRRGRPRIRGNQPAGHAETILLVGSEGGSTWGFAATLHAALTAAGQNVHVGPMSAFAPKRYSRAKRIILLAATYGDGAAPASAQGVPRSAGGCRSRACHPSRGSRLRRPQLSRLLRLRQGCHCRRQGEGLARASALRHDRPPVATGFRTLGPGAWAGARHRPRTLAPARPAEDRDADPRIAPGLWRRGAGADRDPPFRPAACLPLAAD